MPLDKTAPHSAAASYGQISAKTILTNVRFVRYDQQQPSTGALSSGQCAIAPFAIRTNPASVDVVHPTHAQGIKWVNTAVARRLRVDRPNPGWINEEDCIIFDCEGLQQVLINDLDGSFSGLVQSGDDTATDTIYYNVFSESEFNNARARWMIPITMLTRHDGARIAESDLAIGRGIGRTDGCELDTSWQAYRCRSTLNYRMLVVESMDPDTETRSLAPMNVLTTGTGGVTGSTATLFREEALGAEGNNASMAGGYLNQINSQMDHGWCAGYTCLKRLSTFYSIVPVPQHLTIYFMSTVPSKMRWHLLHAADSEAVTIANWRASPNKLRVHVSGDDATGRGDTMRFVDDTNWPEDSYDGTDDFVSPSSADGANAYFRLARTIHFTVKGRGYVEIRTLPLVQVSLTLALNIDSFYDQETEFMGRLAFVLNIPSTRIRVVNVVAGSARINIEIDPIPDSEIVPEARDETESAGVDPEEEAEFEMRHAQFEELFSIQERLVEQALSGVLQDTLGVGVQAMEVVPPTEPLAPIAENSTDVERSASDEVAALEAAESGEGELG